MIPEQQADFQFSRQSFDAVTREYTDARPVYDARLFDAIDSVRHFTPASRILEIGAGTGIATKQTADKWHAHITAVEPGPRLMADARKKLAGYEQIDFITAPFESLKENERTFDAVFSATAFHWLDPAVKYRNSSALLKDNGLLVVFWNYYGRDDPDADRYIQTLYEKYGLSVPGTDPHTLQEAKIKNRSAELAASGYFKAIREDLFTRTEPYTAARYCNLLKTFSDHNRVPHINEFYNELSGFIQSDGGTINVQITAQLEIAVKCSASGL